MSAGSAAPGMSRVWLAITAMILSAACWGLATVLTKGILGQLPPFTLLAVQLTASVAFLWGTVAATRSGVQLNRRALRAASTGLLEPGLAYSLGVPGLALTTAASASVIATAEPALVVLLAWLLLRERPNPRLLIALTVALSGVALVTFSGLGGREQGDLRGDLLVLSGTLFAALYVVASSRMVAEFDPLPLSALQQTVGLGMALVALGVGLVGNFEQLPASVAPTTWLLAALSGVVQYALGFWFYLAGMRVLSAGTAGLFLTLTPVFGVGGAVAFLGEGVMLLQALGSVLVIVAVFGIIRRGGNA